MTRATLSGFSSGDEHQEEELFNDEDLEVRKELEMVAAKQMELRRRKQEGKEVDAVLERLEKKGGWNSVYDNQTKYSSSSSSSCGWIWGDLSISTQYIRADIAREPSRFLVGVSTVFIVVAFMTFVYNIITMSPVIFLKFSENQAGEYDAMIQPGMSALSFDNPLTGGGNQQEEEDEERRRQVQDGDLSDGGGGGDDFSSSEFTVNTTDVRERLKNVREVAGVVPRWITLGTLHSKSNPGQESYAMIMVMDTNKEKEYGIGRFWSHRALGEGEVHASSSLLREVHISPNMGERVVLSLSGLSLISSLFEDPSEIKEAAFPVLRTAIDSISVPVTATPEGIQQALGIPVPPPPPFDPSVPTPPPTPAPVVVVNGSQVPDEVVQQLANNFVDGIISNSQDSSQAQFFSAEFAIADSVDDPAGKWPPAIGNVVVLEMEHIPELLNTLLPQNPYLSSIILQQMGISQEQWANYTSFPVEQYAQFCLIGYTDRYEAYRFTGTALKKKMVDFSNAIMLGLGINYPVTLTLPLYENLNAVQYLRFFLDQFFYGLLAVMTGIAVMLIYSLMISDVDEKTYEFGMLRAMGFKHRSLILLLVILSLCYALPGLIFGLGAAVALSYPCQYFIAEATLTPMTVGLATLPLICGIFLGFFVPFAANVIPIRRALGRALRESLDLYHVTSQEVNVTFMKTEHLGISPWQTYVAIVMIVAGFTVYYLIPLTFAYLQIGLFFGIFTGILLLMILGQGMLGTLVQPRFEKFFLWCLLWGEDVKLSHLVQKNLGAHRPRNMKTGLMFLLALAFVIFVGTNMTLQTRNIQDTVSVFLGGDALVYAASANDPLDEQCLREVMDNEMSKGQDSVVRDYTLVPQRLTRMMSDSQYYHHSVGYQTFAQIQNVFLYIYGVERTYTRATFSDFLSYGDMIDLDYKIDSRSGKPDIIDSLYDPTKNVTYNLDKEIDELYDGEGPKGLLSSELTEPISYRTWNETYNEPIDCLVSAATKDFFQSQIDLPMSLTLMGHSTTTHKGSYEDVRYNIKPRAYVAKMPGFYFSSYRDTTWGSPIVISMDDYYKILSDLKSIVALQDENEKELKEQIAAANAIIKAAPEDLPEIQEQYLEDGYYLELDEAKELVGGPSVSDVKQEGRLKILRAQERGGEEEGREEGGKGVRVADENRVRPNITYRKMMLTLRSHEREDVDTVMNSLRVCLSSDLQRIFDTTSILEGTGLVLDLILYFLYVTSAVQSFLCFFLLWFSFAANVKENSWEFGVLRAVGLSSKQVVRVYMYESLSLILSCIFLGAMIGTFSSVSLTLEGDLFSEMPFKFEFPWSLFLSVTAVSVVVALASAYLATRDLKKKQIAIALRGQ